VCISATVVQDLERLTRDYRDFRAKTAKLEIPVLLGGRIFTDEQLRKRFQAEFYPRNFTDVAEYAQRFNVN
jgi:hypothetical protein